MKISAFSEINHDRKAKTRPHIAVAGQATTNIKHVPACVDLVHLDYQGNITISQSIGRGEEGG